MAEINPVSFSKPSTPDPTRFFHSHQDCYIVGKETYGFSDLAWSSLKITNDRSEAGNYTVIFEIFTGTANSNPQPSTRIVTDENLIFEVQNNNNQYTRSYIQFHSDGQQNGNGYQIRT